LPPTLLASMRFASSPQGHSMFVGALHLWPSSGASMPANLMPTWLMMNVSPSITVAYSTMSDALVFEGWQGSETASSVRASLQHRHVISELSAADCRGSVFRYLSQPSRSPSIEAHGSCDTYQERRGLALISIKFLWTRPRHKRRLTYRKAATLRSESLRKIEHCDPFAIGTMVRKPKCTPYFG
jgi:hypothetical protein